MGNKPAIIKVASLGLVALLLCCSCKAGNEPASMTVDNAGGSPLVVTGGNAPAQPDQAPSIVLPAPSDFALKQSSAIVIQNDGADFRADLLVPNNVAAAGQAGLFEPTWVSPQVSSVEDLAYALYLFELPGFTQGRFLNSSWLVAPEDDALWIGLGNQETQAWDWFSAVPGEQLVVPSIGRYISESDLLMAVVLIAGTGQFMLDGFEFSGEPPSILSVTPIHGEPGTIATFSIEVNGTLDFTFLWDYGGGAIPNTSSDESPQVVLTAPDAYNASVSVSNELGADTWAFTLFLGTPQGDWGMFGHDTQHTSRSEHLGAQTDNVKWSFTTGDRVYSSPAVDVNGVVYVGSGGNKLYAIYPSGALKWVYSTEGRVDSSPAIGVDGTIYVGAGYAASGRLYAISPTGNLKWIYQANANITSSPNLGVDGTVYVGSLDSNLYAIKPDGSLKWFYTTGASIESSPAIGADGTVYVGSGDNKIYAINPDGTERWAFSTGAAVRSSPAIGTDGTVYVGSDDHKLYAINPNGTEQWSFLTGWFVLSSPAIAASGTIYIGSGDNKLYSINPNGTEQWSFPTGDIIRSSPAIGSDGTIYVGSDDERFYAINPDSTEKWSYQLSFGGPGVECSPTIGLGAVVFIGYSSKLYAFGAD